MSAYQTAAYFALAKTLPTVTAFPEITAALDSLDDHLAFRTFLVGHDITAADRIVWGALKGPCAGFIYLGHLSHIAYRQREDRGSPQEQQTPALASLVLPH